MAEKLREEKTNTRDRNIAAAAKCRAGHQMLFTGIDSLDFPQSQIVDAKDIGTFLRYIIKTVTKRNLLTI